MRRTLTTVLLLTVALGGLAVPAAADDDGAGYMLALGDSVAAGTQQPAPFTDDAYPNRLANRFIREGKISGLVNLACPGDDTVEMIHGTGSLCYGAGALLPPGGSSQLNEAVAFLAANPGKVDLITITIGANDVLACSFEDPDVNACIASQLGQIGTNLPVILGTLQAAAPGVPIVGTNYYNPNLAFWITGPEGQALAAASMGLTTVFNDTLDVVYGAFGIPVADVARAFKVDSTRGNVPENVRRTCRLTLMCEKSGSGYVLSDYDPNAPGPQTDIHPSDKGYQRIADTIRKTVLEYNLLAGR